MSDPKGPPQDPVYRVLWSEGLALESFGPAQTAAIEAYVIERLRKSFPDLLEGWPPA